MNNPRPLMRQIQYAAEAAPATAGATISAGKCIINSPANSGKNKRFPNFRDGGTGKEFWWGMLLFFK
jgi:hypothetical protein